MYDLAIIGAGWAGFNAALKAKELGLKVCLIDSDKIGGTCLNYGCIPTKTLIACAKIFSLAKSASGFGIELDNLRVNLATIQEKKDKIIHQLAQGIINTKFILIATGSHSIQLPELQFGQKNIISSDQALSLSVLPQSLLIIGGGVIGCEFASLFSILGSAVTIIEKMPRLLPTEDRDVARKIEVIFKKKGIKVVTGADKSSFDLESYSNISLCRTPRPYRGIRFAGFRGRVKK